MAQAVEKAAVVCCFLTPDYQCSHNCRLELQYANDISKLPENQAGNFRIIPCMLGDKKNPKWKPSDWLGLIISGQQWVNMKNDSDSNIRMKAQELIGRIRNEFSVLTADASHLPIKLFEMIREKYLRENHRIKRLMNEEKSFPIEQNYINLAILETKEQQEKEKQLKQPDNDNQIDEENEQNKLRKHQNKDILGTFEEIYGNKTTIDVENIFEKCKDQTKKILVLGRAGIGKSTFCQYITYRWAKGEIWPQYRLVVLIRLRSLTDSRYPRREPPYTTMDLVKKEYLEVEDISDEMTHHLKEQCSKGLVLWILDGYDEFVQNIPEQLKGVFKHIGDTQHHILTSRPYAIALPYDTKLEITGFTNENIPRYIEQFFDQIKTQSKSAISNGQKLQEFLKSNANIWGVAHIPVNLELICSLWSDYDWSKTAILTMTQLYSKITEWLCRRYLTRKNINHEDMTNQDLYKECEMELQFLEYLAFNAMERKEIMLPPELLEKTETQLGCSLRKYPQLLNIGILRSYDDRATGSSIDRQKQHYFVHLSFQEYFAARHLVKNLKGPHSLEATDFMKNNKYNQRFHFVFVFASGLLAQSDFKSNTDVFWNNIEAEPLDLVGLKHITLITECMDQLIGTSVLPNRTNYLKSISHWITMSLTKTATLIQQTLLQSLNRANSIVNTSTIQKQFIKLLGTEDVHSKCSIYEFISKLSMLNPIAALLLKISADLQDQAPNIRRSACETLKNFGEKAVTDEVIAAMLNALTNKDSDVRWAACDLLEKFGEKAATDEVVTAMLNSLQDKDSAVRRSSCNALGNMGEKGATNEVIAALQNALQDEDSGVRREVCYALLKMGETAAMDEVIVGIQNALQHKTLPIRFSAWSALAHMDERAVTDKFISSMLNALRDGNSNVRTSTCTAFLMMGEKAATDEVIAALQSALQDEDSNVRDSVCQALVKMGGTAATEKVIAAMLNVFQHEDADLQVLACEVLGKMGEKSVTDEVIAAMLNGLQNEDWNVRSSTCEALGSMGKKGATDEVITAVLNALQDENWNVRVRAYYILLRMGETADTDRFIAAMQNALKHEEPVVRYGACCALGRMGEKAITDKVIIALLNALQDEYPNVRVGACDSLGHMSEKAATNKVVAALQNALLDEDSAVKRSAWKALGKMDGKGATNEAIIAILNALRDEDSDVRGAACVALGSMGEKAATDQVITAMLNALRDEVWKVRTSACEAFGNMGEKAAIDEVITALQNALLDKDWSVRHEACKVLRRMGEKSATDEGIIAMLNLLRDENEHVRSEASISLSVICEKSIKKEVLETLVNEYSCGGTDNSHTIAESLQKIICSYDGKGELDPQIVSKICSCIDWNDASWGKEIPASHLFKILLDTQNAAWIPLVSRVALYQGVAVTLMDNRLRIYDANGSLEFDVTHSELVKSLVEASRNQLEELKRCSLAGDGTLSTI
ncbi:unnamed protein product [Rotaria magnacalcarata]|uniref:NACHT domain-containing protein n=1 Tax=Rotaria magnacalcarata TaxID=392030 RepID=A0A814VHR7_9BILA|nr:unnamed protein product [Rotaria magnacalcarata]CAF3875230.1 unnamed protein product [Rotaria magnacalcarata]